MRKNVFAVIVVFMIVASGMAQENRVAIFVSGTEGHKSYRIQAIVGTPNGNLLAFCEGRVNDAGDFGDVNIVMIRSRDKGKTWSDLQTIVDNNSLQAGNCAPVVDVTDPAYPGENIFILQHR